MTETSVISKAESSLRNEGDNKIEAAGDLHAYLRKLEAEVKRRPDVNYIQEHRKDISANTREILVDWLVKVAEVHRLGSDTLYLTVSYFDRFLSVNEISRHRLLLLGVSAMLIAANYEEIDRLKAEDLCYTTDNMYTKQEVVEMEADILKLLNFEMGSPTVNTFLWRYSRADQYDRRYWNTKLESMANFIAELSLQEYKCLQFLPSKIAASAIFLSRFAIEPYIHPWTSKLQQQTNYNPSELRDCITVLYSLLMNLHKSSLSAIKDKYKQQRFNRVSVLAHYLPSKIPESHFQGF